MKDYVSGVIDHSGKMVILMEIIEHCTLLHEKILVFRSIGNVTYIFIIFTCLFIAGSSYVNTF